MRAWNGRMHLCHLRIETQLWNHIPCRRHRIGTRKHGSYKANLGCYIRKGRSRTDHGWMPTFKRWRARVTSHATHKIRIVIWRDLGFWNHEEYDIELQPGVKPYHARAHPIPKIHEQALRTEVERLCSIGVLRNKVNRSEWAAPTFIIPKKKERFDSFWTSAN